MPFGLTMGTERANALQQSIQDELTKRGYSQDADPVMAEYITIMVINNKTAGQITTELEDLIGSEYDPTFTDWLFVEAAKGTSAPESSQQPQPLPPISTSPSNEQPTHEPPSHPPRDSSSRTLHPPRSGIYQQAVSQATSFNSSQKRSASARSPSPGLLHKSRKTDLPTGPRAMQRDGGPAATRSLLDRMGGHPASSRHQRDEIQARIDNITNNSSEANMMMGGGGFPNIPMAGIDMNAMAMANPLMLQEMFMNNMALMQHLSSQIGVMQSFANTPPGFNMSGNGVVNEAGMFHGGPNNFGQANRGRGSGRGRGAGRGRGGTHVGTSSPKVTETAMSSEVPATPSSISSQPSANVLTTTNPAFRASTPAIIPASPAPTPAIVVPTATSAQTSSVSQIPYAVPERPQSPTLCKFGLKCTNVHCRWSHPSPVATPESGVVLSNEACENGKNCKDKDCIKAHVSPAVLHPPAQPPVSAPAAVPHSPPNLTPCRFGLACTRPNCMFSHPSRPTSNSQYATPCRFGAACTRAACPYQHPEGRVLPTTFHRGLAPNGPMVHIPNPETGSMGPSPHRSVTFNNPKSKFEKQVKDLEERKNDAEKAIQEAQVAATANANGKEELKPVATAA